MQKNTTSKVSISEKEIRSRYEKLKTLRQEIDNSLPNRFIRTDTASSLHVQYDNKHFGSSKSLKKNISLAGRIISIRIMGRSSFITLQDFTGTIQLYMNNASILKDDYKKKCKMLDLGDIIGVKGGVFKTKTQELSVYCTEIVLLTKSLLPFPGKFHRLMDREKRCRQRYIDLIANSYSRNIFKTRSYFIKSIRDFMSEKKFLEVETPMLLSNAGTAIAESFITHHNALSENMYLRIAPELYLKRLIVGGFERIFEINKNFRNEGISIQHNPEFTMMEVYIAYADYKDLIIFTEELLLNTIKKTLEKDKILYGNYCLDFTVPFKKLTMHAAIKKYCKSARNTDLNSMSQVKKLAISIDIKIKDSWVLGKIISEIFEKCVEKELIQPTFITEYPSDISPLARRINGNPNLSERFELFVAGMEIGNGFSELNDAEMQSKIFQKQALEKNCSTDLEKEGFFYDKDYVVALEYGLPPTAGLGIGIDRLVMLLTNSHNIRDVILFPIMRPKSKNNIEL